ncbi:MAG: methionine--tRNA ligase [Euryarchaeota archaeon]|nr:methionine--tRNA ligase [Euryarchaeota archaeon]
MTGKSKQKVLITCALPYVNNVPHIGNIAGSHLPADIFARFCRLAGHETVFIGGSDEHGTPIEVSAEKLGVDPQTLCDQYYRVHKEIYDWLLISYDNFSRTSLPIHHETTQEFFRKVYENGYVVEGTLRLPSCEKCGRVLPDRYVEGTCPKCGYEGARGDQCEKCSSMLNPGDLRSPRCAICGSAPVFKDIKHLFLSLDKLEARLKEWIEGNRDVWSPQVVNMALGWIHEGLKPRSITRDIKWGVKVPLEGFEDRVFYVWFDAPIGYVSSTKEWAQKIGKPEEWRRFWQEEDAKIFHFIGKDNIPFHTIFWPGMLMANGEFTLPYRVAGLQYLNYEGDKISKSRGFGIFCENLSRTGTSPDIWRYYLTLLIPETGDTEWKWREFQERVNKELVANLGNFVYRTLSFTMKNFDGRVPGAELSGRDRELLERGKRYAEEVGNLIWDIRLRDALKKVFELSDEGNRYFQENEPWKAVKEDPERAAACLHVCANLCYDLAVLLSPFLPESAERICAQLGMEVGTLEDVGQARVEAGQELRDVRPLFPKLDDKKIAELREITSSVTEYEEMFKVEEEYVSYEEFKRLDLRTAEVLEAGPVEGADKLLKLKIRVGGKEKQLVAGLAPYYRPEELVGKTIVVVNNLKPAKLRGEVSEGMLLAAVDGKKVALLTPDKDVKSGSKVE